MRHRGDLLSRTFSPLVMLPRRPGLLRHELPIRQELPPANTRSATDQFYSTEARSYAEQTRDLDMSRAHKRFAAHVATPGPVLDAGCGSGRDSQAFLRKGYEVVARDASPELAAGATEFLGQAVDVGRHQDTAEQNMYRGIFCSASLLHVPYAEWPDVLSRFATALHRDGVLYLTVKAPSTAGHAMTETVDTMGRHFTSFSAEGLRAFLTAHGWAIREEWQDIDAQRPDTVWIGAIATPLRTS